MTDTISVNDLLTLLGRLQLENASLRDRLETAEDVMFAAEALSKASLFERNLARARLRDWVAIYRKGG